MHNGFRYWMKMPFQVLPGVLLPHLLRYLRKGSEVRQLRFLIEFRIQHLCTHCVYKSLWISISGYSSPTLRTALIKFPSASFTIFAFVTMVTFFLPFFLANSNAARAILSLPCLVCTLKSTARSSFTWIPLFPQIYSPSIFSRKKVQSMFLSGILIGRTALRKVPAIF